MTQDDIIEMAKQAGINFRRNVFHSGYCDGVHGDELKTFAKLVEQRKVNQIADACAKLPFGDTAHSFAVWIKDQA
jgi:hypothetical protein